MFIGEFLVSINLLTVVNNRSYGIWGKNVLKALHQLGAEYSFFPLHPIDLAQDEGDFVQPIQAGLKQAEFFYKSGDSLAIWHEFCLGQQVGKRKVAWTLFELDKLNDIQRYHLNYQDLVLLPSEWHINVACENRIVSDMKVCPLGVDTSKFFPMKTVEKVGFSFGNDQMIKEEVKSRDKTIFISVGKWEKRKSHDLLPSLFSKAFTKKDNVELRCFHHNPFLNEEQVKAWLKLYYESPLASKIKVYSDYTIQNYNATDQQITYKWYDQKGLTENYNMADAALCLSRTEGWDLPALEALACGLPVIATNYAGHTGFLNENNARLIPIKKLESANDGVWFNGFGNWASIDSDAEDAIIHHMREIHRMKQEGQDLTNQAGIKTAHEHSWLNVTNKLLEILGA